MIAVERAMAGLLMALLLGPIRVRSTRHALL